MERRVKISVVMPVYKAEHTLARAVDSILAQTFQDFELILVDDGSPDASGAIADDYARRDARVRVIHQDNRGAAEARHTGQKAATGEFRMHVDSDDTIRPDAMETLLRFAQENDLDCVYPGYNRIIGGKTFVVSAVEQPLILNSRQMLEKMIDQDFLFIATLCFSRASLWTDVDSMFPPADSLIPGEDLIINYRLVSKADKIGIIGTPLYNYHLTQGSLTSSGRFFTTERIHDFFNQFEAILGKAGILGDVESKLNEMKIHWMGFYPAVVDPGDPWVKELRAIPSEGLRRKYRVLQLLLANNTLRRSAITVNRFIKRLLGNL